VSYWKINPALCKRDGFCVAECPSRLLEIKAGSPVPTPVAGAEERCVKCGHCVAVCPHQALALTDMKPEDCAPVQNQRLLDSEAVEYLFRSRRSIRVYQNKNVEQPLIAKLLDMVRYAPTGGNSQQVKWLVINSRERVREIGGQVIEMMRALGKNNSAVSEKYRWPRIIKAWEEGIDGITRDASALVLAHAPKEYGLAVVDTTIALTYLDLAAQTLGLGACWAGFVMLAMPQWPPLQQLLALPPGRVCFGVMMLGYPKHQYHRLPLRKAADITWRE
jgi:nitroreductase/NAD-dependent dihydropyrimidine dehydrogenase PreA subunit